MIEVRAPSRLHFGLLNPGGGEPWPNLDGDPVIPGRRFGGVGMMIEEPGLVVRVEPAREWSASGPLAERALEFARRFAETVPNLSPHHVHVEHLPAEHIGLGTGTQLGLAVAKALAVAVRHADWDAEELATRVGRGLRSAVGIHGFDRGGLIVEAGKRDVESIASLLVREEVPEAWRIVVALPMGSSGLHGAAERLAFDQLDSLTALNETLCRLVLLGMLPALRERDCAAFGESLHDFNARVGEFFAAAQGGRYATAIGAELVKFVRGLGVSGVGQSSWGPTIFAVVELAQRADDVERQIKKKFGDSLRTWLTRPSRGAVVTG